jgi:hypothetical protein
MTGGPARFAPLRASRIVDLVPPLGYERQPIAYGPPAFGASGDPDSGVPKEGRKFKGFWRLPKPAAQALDSARHQTGNRPVLPDLLKKKI